jgi:hypothetical protein
MLWQQMRKSFIIKLMQSSRAATGSDQYNFIMDSGKAAPSGKFPLSNTPKKGRIIIIVAGAIILAIIGSIVAAMLSSGGDKTIKDLTLLSQQQQELVRIAEIGVQKARSTDAQNLALTTKYSISSDQKQTLTYLASQKHKVSAKTLGLRKNTQTDATLNSAAQNNRFDEVFTQTIGNLLLNYKAAVSQTYNDATARPNAKKLMNTLYNNINVLSTQTKGAQELNQ